MLTLDEWKLLREEIQKAVDWMDSKQPEDAILSHHGITYGEKIGPITLSFCIGYGSRGVFVFNHEHMHDLSLPEHMRKSDWQGYTEEEIAAIRETVEHATPVVSDWNGVGFGTYSIAIGKPWGDGVYSAFLNYRKAGSQIFDDQFWIDNPVKVTKPEGWR